MSYCGEYRCTSQAIAGREYCGEHGGYTHRELLLMRVDMLAKLTEQNGNCLHLTDEEIKNVISNLEKILISQLKRKALNDLISRESRTVFRSLMGYHTDIDVFTVDY